MERLFSPCTRLHDILESQGVLEDFRLRMCYPEHLQELNLDVSTEELLSAERGFTFADLYATLGNEDTVAWLTLHAAVVREDGLAVNAWRQLDESCRFSFTADGIEITAFAFFPEHLLEICDVVVRLVAVSVVHSLLIERWSPTGGAFIIAPTLEYLMEQCQSLKVLTLSQLNALDEDHIRVLGAYSRPDLEIELHGCTITSVGTSALVEGLGQNQGPTKLALCEIDSFVLADGLRGNSSLKSLKPRFSRSAGVANRQVLAIAGALRENKGLVDLDLSYGYDADDETWGAICDSLKAHPTIEVLNLWSTSVPSVITSRIVVDMLKVNMSIHTIRFNDFSREHELFRELVIPYLETNRLRPRVRAIQKTRPITYRAKVLGLAFLAVRTDPNRFWMLFSENAEVVFA
jgi:hypothetical protein